MFKTVDWSNVGTYSRGYGFALDHNIEYMIDRDYIRFLIYCSMSKEFLK